MSAAATSVRGDGPPVLVTVAHENASGFGWSPHGTVAAGSFGLLPSEARALAAQLFLAAEEADIFEGTS